MGPSFRCTCCALDLDRKILMLMHDDHSSPSAGATRFPDVNSSCCVFAYCICKRFNHTIIYSIYLKVAKPSCITKKSVGAQTPSSCPFVSAMITCWQKASALGATTGASKLTLSCFLAAKVGIQRDAHSQVPFLSYRKYNVCILVQI